MLDTKMYNCFRTAHSVFGNSRLNVCQLLAELCFPHSAVVKTVIRYNDMSRKGAFNANLNNFS